MYPVGQNLIERPPFSKVYSIKDSDEGRDFPDYLTSLGLICESRMLVLSTSHHFSFDYNDLKDLTVLVMLRKLERVRHPDSFMQIVFRILPPKAYFIGCFTICKTQEDGGFPLHYTSNDIDKLIDLLEPKTYLHLHKNNVSGIFRSYGFKIFDMAEINNLVYFAIQH
jgi:hypothetical protein